MKNTNKFCQTNFVVFCLLALFLSACHPKAEFSSSVDKTSSSEFKLFDPTEMDSFLDSQKLSVQDREQAIRAMQLSFKNSYIGYYSKKSLAGLDGDEIFDLCVLENAQMSDAISVLEYRDLISKCVARFRDAHLYFSASGPQTFISTAIASILPIEGKILVNQIRPQVLDKFIEMASSDVEKETLKKLTVGVEVLEIDGEPVHVTLADFARYNSSSSRLANAYGSAAGFFTRKILYPKSSLVEVKFLDLQGQPQVVRLPWIQMPQPGPFHSKYQLRKYGILPVQDLSNDMSFTGRSGLDISSPVFSLTQVQSYEGDQETILQTGVYEAPDKGLSVCYYQLNSFSLDSDNEGVFRVQPGNQDLVQVSEQFLKSCQEKGQSLVVDIRNNGGGDAALAHQLMRLFVLDDDKVPFAARSLYVGTGNFSVLMQALRNLNPIILDFRVSNEILWRGIPEGIKRPEKMTDWVLSRPIGLILNKSYQKDFIVLISPECVSACEMFSRGLRLSSKAIFVGQGTQGTGFGFSSVNNMATVYSDPWNLFRISLPNFAFAVSLSQQGVSSEQNIFELAVQVPLAQIPIAENTPVEPDLEYSLKASDLSAWSSYQKFLNSILEGIKIKAENQQP